MRTRVLIFFLPKLWEKKLKRKSALPAIQNLSVFTVKIVGVLNIQSAKPTKNTLPCITMTAYAKTAFSNSLI